MKQSLSIWCWKHNWLSFLTNGCSASARSQWDPLIYSTLLEKPYRRWRGCWPVCRETGNACGVYPDATTCSPALLFIFIQGVIGQNEHPIVILHIQPFQWNPIESQWNPTGIPVNGNFMWGRKISQLVQMNFCLSCASYIGHTPLTRLLIFAIKISS